MVLYSVEVSSTEHHETHLSTILLNQTVSTEVRRSFSRIGS